MQETTARTEQSNRDSDVLQHTPLLKEPLWTSPPSAGCWQIAQATTRSSTQCQCPGAPILCSSKEQQLPCPSTAVPAPNTHRFPSLEATGPGLSRSYQLCCLNTSRQRKGKRPCSGELPLANFSSPPHSRHPRSEGDTVRSAVCAPAVRKEPEWEWAGLLINALLFMLKRKKEDDAYTRLALRQLSRAVTG